MSWKSVRMSPQAIELIRPTEHSLVVDPLSHLLRPEGRLLPGPKNHRQLLEREGVDVHPGVAQSGELSPVGEGRARGRSQRAPPPENRGPDHQQREDQHPHPTDSCHQTGQGEGRAYS